MGMIFNWCKDVVLVVARGIIAAHHAFLEVRAGEDAARIAGTVDPRIANTHTKRAV